MIKKLFLFNCSIALIAIFMGGCRKDTTQNNSSGVKKHQYKPSTAKAIDPAQLEPNNMSWADRVIGYDDQDAGFRKAKLFYSLALREIVKDPVIADWIYTQAKQAENNVIYLDDVFDAFPGTRNIAAAVSNPLQELNGWSLEQITGLMQYDDYRIKPAIYLMNAEHADPDFKPMVSPGDDLDVEDNEERGDVVLAWHLDNNNQATAVNIWESLAENLEAPVLCIDGLATNLTALNNNTLLNTSKTTEYFPPTDHPNMRLTLTRYRIGYRYDAGAKSEVNVVARCILDLNPADVTSSKTWGTRNFFRINCFTSMIPGDEITKVHKRDINKTRSIDRYFAKAHSPWPLNLLVGEYDHYMLSTASGPRLMNRKSIAFNFYERDGFASGKRLMRIKINTTRDEEIVGKMSKYNEWYLFNPNDYFQDYAVTMPYPYIGWIHDEDHGKADIRLQINNHCTY